jgi:hypothetical protein
MANITFANGVFVASNGNSVFISTDGINWSAKLGTNALITSGLFYKNGLFLSGASNGLFLINSILDIGKYNPSINRYDFSDSNYALKD